MGITSDGMKGRGGSEPPPLCGLVQEVLVILAGELVPGIGASAQGLAVTQLLDVPKAGCDPAVAVGVVAKEGAGDAAEATGVHLALVDDGLHRGVHDLRLLATVGVDEVGILVRRVIRAVDVAIPQGGLQVGGDLAAPLGQGVLLGLLDGGLDEAQGVLVRLGDDGRDGVLGLAAVDRVTCPPILVPVPGLVGI